MQHIAACALSGRAASLARCTNAFRDLIRLRPVLRRFCILGGMYRRQQSSSIWCEVHITVSDARTQISGLASLAPNIYGVRRTVSFDVTLRGSSKKRQRSKP